MIGTIRRHSKVLWLIIIAAIIITFVYWGAAPARYNDAGSTGNFGTINGHVVTRDELGAAQREVFLRHFFSVGEWPQAADESIQRDTYIRLFLIQKQEELGIHVSSDTVAKVAANLLRSFNRGNPVPLDAFVTQVLSPRGLTADDFRRFVGHDLGIEQVMAVAGLSGKLITPEDIKALYEREHQEISAQAVFFSASNHLDEVKVTPDAIAEFYTNQMANYRLPERVQVAYVQFPASNFLADAEKELNDVPNLADQIDAQYERMGGTNFFRDAKSPEDAKKIIRETEIERIAVSYARKKANEFATELFAMEPVSTENLGKLAAQKGFVAHLSEPFDRQYPPSDLKVQSDFIKQAFALTANEPFAGPISGEDAAYVIALGKRLPSEIPSLDNIRQRVTSDYKHSHAVALASQAGARFAAMLAAGIPNGKSFSAIATEAKVHPVVLPPFSPSTRSLPQVEQHTDLSQFKVAAFSAAPGKTSDFVRTAQGGFVVFVQSKLPIDVAKMETDLPKFAEAKRRAYEIDAFNRWFGKQAEQALRNTPVFRAQTAPAGVPPEQ